MVKRDPRLKKLVISERDKKTNDPLIWCRGDDGETYMLQLDDGMVIHLALALLDQAAKAAPTDHHQTAAALQAIGFSTGFDAAGEPLIRFRLENDACIGIVLGKDLLSPLRQQIADLEVVIQRESRD